MVDSLVVVVVVVVLVIIIILDNLNIHHDVLGVVTIIATTILR